MTASSGRCHTPRRSFVVAEALAARVVAERPHPHAHLIRIAVVEAGDRRWRVVYGGTRRLAPGDVVPVATPGTRLTAASGLRLPPLRARNFRGVRSEAMLCSSDELGWTVGGPDEVLVLDPGHEVGALVRRPSGRCHGPGCTRTALLEGGFCGEVCQARWHGQFDSESTHTIRVHLACWTDPATIERLRQAVAQLVGVRERLLAVGEAAAGARGSFERFERVAVEDQDGGRP